ncbi:L-aminoadipate-semialdehyde dehydrogenase-phosphopantetheinyl transferase-like [Ruditapes philippinarum]|uniref:L-aminoadipate-semialdehyde dehydrogenase-phosphopantetheinyl transferase-like n=1 Tax=Ruditapes philippinarum TaxID=129788 RepID=UPI00295B2888|nr:L-aminoadipate-semialdehyde dehydrogenase-phosphopantetheinyl transferase-like [Ruditapes philippinarum]
MRISRLVMTSTRWAFNTRQWEPTVSDWVKASQCIQSEEKERIGKFVFKKDAKSSMIGRLMLRKMLHRRTKIPYADIKLGRTEKGKPYLMNNTPEGCEKLSFNVSHHGDYVVLAAETFTDVGIDVMKLETPVGANSISDFFHTMRRQFTQDEWVYIKSGKTEQDQLGNFYRLWCLKESYVKALGVGIGFEVKRLNFLIKSDLPSVGQTIDTTQLEVDGQFTIHWTFEETLLDNHCIAVAETSSNPVKNPFFEVLTFNQLLEDSNPLSDPDQKYGEEFIKKPERPKLQR